MLTEGLSKIVEIPHLAHVLIPGAYLMLAGIVGVAAVALVLRRYRG